MLSLQIEIHQYNHIVDNDNKIKPMEEKWNEINPIIFNFKI
jgi:hypothetical protein